MSRWLELELTVVGALVNGIWQGLAIAVAVPVILIPQQLESRLGTDDLDQLGVHELAHLERRDDWTQLGEKLLTAIYWFHPGVWLLTGWLGFQRELACDQIAVGWTQRPRSYARCLLRLLEHGGRRAPTMATGAVAKPSQAARRIEALLRRGAKAAPALSRSRLIGVGMVLVVVGAALLVAPPLFSFERPSARGWNLVHIDVVDHTRFSWSERGRRIELRLDGRVDFDDDLTTIESIAAGGSLKLRERDGLRVRSVTVEPEGSDLVYRYASMGLPRDFDRTAQAWFSEVLPEAIALSGVGARDRAQRLLDDEGVDTLLANLSATGASRALVVDLEVLLEEATLSPTQLERTVAMASNPERVEAQHHRAALLHSLVGRG